MSELLKSLAQSEQAYQATQTISSVIPSHPHYITKKRSLVLFAFLVLLPSFLSMAYIGYDAHQSWEQQREQARITQDQHNVRESAFTESSVQFIRYPDVRKLKSLSEIKLALHVENKDGIKMQKNTMVGLKIPSKPTIEKMSSIKSAQQVSPTSNDMADDFQYKSLDLSELSPNLAKKVQNALDGESSHEPKNADDMYDVVETIKLVNDEYQFKDKLPAMNLQTHMYASDATKSWVKINGQELHEGDWLDASIQLLTITPRTITIGFQGEVIEIPALYEWKG